MIQRLSEENHFEILGGHVAKEIRLKKAILVRSTVLAGPLNRFSKRGLGYVHANIIFVSGRCKFVRGITWSTSKIEDGSTSGILFEIGINAITGCVVYKVPLGAREFSIPQHFFDIGAAIAFEKCTHQRYGWVRDIHVFIPILIVNSNDPNSDHTKRRGCF